MGACCGGMLSVRGDGMLRVLLTLVVVAGQRARQPPNVPLPGMPMDARSAHKGPDRTIMSLRSSAPEPVRLDPQRIPTSRTGRRLLDHTEVHNIQILQDKKLAEMQERAATFTYYPDVNEAQGPPANCLKLQAKGGPVCKSEVPAVRIALNKLFHAINGYWWMANTNWRTSENYCNWAALSCDEQGVLRTIHMDDYQITDWYNATLPDELGNITSLRELSMACSYIKGRIPSSIVNMKELQYLDLHGNELTGIIPRGLKDIRGLLYLDLTYNKLEGWTFFNGQPADPWRHWGKLTKIEGGGRESSPNRVTMQLNSFHVTGREGTMIGKYFGNPGVGGTYPLNDIVNSYADKVPTSKVRTGVNRTLVPSNEPIPNNSN